MKFLVLIASVLVFQSAAFADQCAWNDVKYASAAKKLFFQPGSNGQPSYRDVIFWCQNCGEKKPSTKFHITDVKTSKAQMNGKTFDYRVVKVKAEYLVDKDGTEIDLAYTYVRTGPKTFTNLAHLVGCPSEGAISHIETFSGKDSAKKVGYSYDLNGIRKDLNTANSIKYNAGTVLVPTSMSVDSSNSVDVPDEDEASASSAAAAG